MASQQVAPQGPEAVQPPQAQGQQQQQSVPGPAAVLVPAYTNPQPTMTAVGQQPTYIFQQPAANPQAAPQGPQAVLPPQAQGQQQQQQQQLVPGQVVPAYVNPQPTVMAQGPQAVQLPQAQGQQQQQQQQQQPAPGPVAVPAYMNPQPTVMAAGQQPTYIFQQPANPQVVSQGPQAVQPPQAQGRQQQPVPGQVAVPAYVNPQPAVTTAGQQPTYVVQQPGAGTVGYYPRAQGAMPQIVVGAQTISTRPPRYEYTPSNFKIVSILTIIICGIFSPLSLVFSIPALLFANKSQASAKAGNVKKARSQGMIAAYLTCTAVLFALLFAMFLTGLVVGLYGPIYQVNRCLERADTSRHSDYYYC